MNEYSLPQHKLHLLMPLLAKIWNMVRIVSSAGDNELLEGKIKGKDP